MSSEFCIDANILLTAWNDYPIDVFPSLWLAFVAHRNTMALIKPIYDEMQSPPPLIDWLIQNKFKPIPVSEEIRDKAFALQSIYRPKVKSLSKAISKTDLILIAYAKATNRTVVTFEGAQPQAPQDKQRWRIPLVCEMEGVSCVTFVTMLHVLGIRV